MAEDPSNTGAGFTTKEMLIRMDGKLDVLAAKQTHYDVELALLKARSDQQEQAKVKIEDQLNEAKELMASEVQNIKDGQVSLSRGIKWATGTVIGASIIIDAAIRFFK